MGESERLLRFANDRPFSKSLVIIALQIAIISGFLSFYNVEIPSQPAFRWIKHQIYKVHFIKSVVKILQEYLHIYLSTSTQHAKEETTKPDIEFHQPMDRGGDIPIFTPEQLSLFDGTRQSKPVYLAILGQIYNVDKGRKHYGQGGGYHFFAGKDATKSFVTGDFSTDGQTADVTGLSETELLSISDWVAFYERDYQFVGFLSGLYYDQKGRPTDLLKEVNRKIADAKQWKQKQANENEVFPPCNSEWKKDNGGRVWCTSKSGGITRDWVGVPRKLFNPSTKNHRCVCVKNFGTSLSAPELSTNRGDLDNPNLREYPECPQTSNSCKIPA